MVTLAAVVLLVGFVALYLFALHRERSLRQFRDLGARLHHRRLRKGLYVDRKGQGLRLKRFNNCASERLLQRARAGLIGQDWRAEFAAAGDSAYGNECRLANRGQPHREFEVKGA